MGVSGPDPLPVSWGLQAVHARGSCRSHCWVVGGGGGLLYGVCCFGKKGYLEEYKKGQEDRTAPEGDGKLFTYIHYSLGQDDQIYMGIYIIHV